MLGEQPQADTRAADIRQAFLLNSEHLRSVAYEQWPSMAWYHTDDIMTNLSHNLTRYRRPADQRFILWASAWIRRETLRHRFFHEIFEDNHQLVYSAIQRSLFSCPAEDASREPCDHEADVILHLLQNIKKVDRIMRPEKAKSTTVFYSLVKSRMRGFRSLISDRRNIVDRHLRGYGDLACEYVVSDQEKSEITAAA